tara:strand:- start:2958 stop:3206 length:249 start_codon:yes stop_codon:yes gene_type:complete
MSEESAEQRADRRRRREARRTTIDDSIPSPCISVCQMDPQQDYCVGCLRSIAEIRDWMIMNKTQKESVLAAIATRAAAQKTP